MTIKRVPIGTRGATNSHKTFELQPCSLFRHISMHCKRQLTPDVNNETPLNVSQAAQKSVTSIFSISNTKGTCFPILGSGCIF